jgi:two-component system sensor histidine kinase FlrB
MPNGGELSLQTRLAPAQNGQPIEAIVVTISDTGPGNPVEAQQQIFEPFFTTKARGTGLGLTVARRIVEEHGGTISIQSGATQGTCFVISLPIAQRVTT